MIISRGRLDKDEAKPIRKPCYFVAGFQTFKGANQENRIVVMQGSRDDSRVLLMRRAGMNVAPFVRKILEGD